MLDQWNGAERCRELVEEYRRITAICASDETTNKGGPSPRQRRSVDLHRIDWFIVEDEKGAVGAFDRFSELSQRNPQPFLGNVSPGGRRTAFKSLAAYRGLIDHDLIAPDWSSKAYRQRRD